MTILYEKRGRRYYPVHDTAAMDGLPDGTWYLDVKGGRRIAVRAEDSDSVFSPIAAIPALSQAICDAMTEASACQLRTRSTAASEREREAFAAWAAVMGDELPLSLERPSVHEVAVKVARRIAELADRTSASGREIAGEMSEPIDPPWEQSAVRYLDEDGDIEP